MDRLTKAQRSCNMAKIRSKNTRPELLLRKSLFGKGVRYRIHDKLEGKPDIVLPKKKIAIFIHGCFWHQHKCKRNKGFPKTNRDYWNPKLQRNIKRDKQITHFLEKEGWTPVVVWECEVYKSLPMTTAKILKIINTDKYNKKKTLNRLQEAITK